MGGGVRVGCDKGVGDDVCGNVFSKAGERRSSKSLNRARRRCRERKQVREREREREMCKGMTARRFQDAVGGQMSRAPDPLM
jgi:hypothetical protein